MNFVVESSLQFKMAATFKSRNVLHRFLQFYGLKRPLNGLRLRTIARPSDFVAST